MESLLKHSENSEHEVEPFQSERPQLRMIHAMSLTAMDTRSWETEETFKRETKKKRLIGTELNGFQDQVTQKLGTRFAWAALCRAMQNHSELCSLMQTMKN